MRDTEYLLDKGAGINGILFQSCLESSNQEKHSRLETPLYSAAVKRDPDMVEEMLIKGEDSLIKGLKEPLIVKIVAYYNFKMRIARLRSAKILT